MPHGTDSGEHRVCQPTEGLAVHWKVGRPVSRRSSPRRPALGDVHDTGAGTTPALARHRRWHDTDRLGSRIATSKQTKEARIHHEDTGKQEFQAPRARVRPGTARSASIPASCSSCLRGETLLSCPLAIERTQPAGQQYRQPAPSDDFAASSRRLATSASTRSMSFARLNGLRRISDPSTASRKPAL
jgi:hypothetical protein